MIVLKKLQILISVFSWYLFAFYSADASFDGTNIGCIPRPFRAKLVNLKETKERATAYTIYSEYGVGDKHNICKSYDKKTRYLNGYGLCKAAVDKLKNYSIEGADQYIVDDAWCEWIEMNAEMYKHADKFAVLEVPTYRPSSKETYRRSLVRHKMVKCASKRGVTLFLILHAKGNFYYIFEGIRNHPNILLCLQLTLNDSYYPRIPIQETNDTRLLDDIFGQHGTMDLTDDKHMCKHLEKDSVTFAGRPICEAILEKEKNNFLEDMKVQCTRKKIHRIEPKKLSSGYPLVTSLMVVTCWYGNGTEPKAIWIANTPVENFYYVFRLSSGKLLLTNIFELKTTAPLKFKKKI